MNLYKDIKTLINRYNYALYWNGKSLPDAADNKPAVQFRTISSKEWQNTQGHDICRERGRLTIWDSYPDGCEGFENACELSKDSIVAYSQIVRRILTILTEHMGYERLTGENGAYEFKEIDYPKTSDCMIGVTVEFSLQHCKTPKCCKQTDFDLTGIVKELPNWKKRQ